MEPHELMKVAMQGLLPDSNKIDALVASSQATLDKFNSKVVDAFIADGKIHLEGWVTGVLASPVNLSFDIPLPKQKAGGIYPWGPNSQRDEPCLSVFSEEPEQDEQCFTAFNRAYQHQKTLGVCSVSECKELDAVANSNGAHRRFLARIVHRHTVKRYQQIEGKPLPVTALGSIDWPTIEQWFKDHWLQVVGLMLQLLMFL